MWLENFWDYEVRESNNQMELDNKLEEVKDLALKLFCDKLKWFSLDSSMYDTISNKMIERLAKVTVGVTEMYGMDNRYWEYIPSTNIIRLNSTYIKSLWPDWVESKELQELLYHEIRHAMYVELEEFLTTKEFVWFGSQDNLNLIRNLRFSMKQMLSKEYALSNWWTKDLHRDKETLNKLVWYKKELDEVWNEYLWSSDLKSNDHIFGIVSKYFITGYLWYETYEELMRATILDWKVQISKEFVNELQEKVEQWVSKLAEEYKEDIDFSDADKEQIKKFFLDNIDTIIIDSKVGTLMDSIETATNLFRSKVNSEVYYIFDDKSHTEAYARFTTHEMIYIRENIDYTNQFELRKFIKEQIWIVEKWWKSAFASLTVDSYDLKIFKIMVQEDETGFDLIGDYIRLLQWLVYQDVNNTPKTYS